ncbi:MAG TPA: class I SAM-dependent methyltransferase [Anaerolineaceae bacterium]|nr:class I SAM-dependent methyltransferase [Anaerolineaceae bacterium]
MKGSYSSGLKKEGQKIDEAHTPIIAQELEDFWEFYWETRLRPIENLGKRAAILAASRLIRKHAQAQQRPLRVLELGCGEGQIIGSLLDAHFQVCDIRSSVGVDHDPRSLMRCRQNYPGMGWVEGDFTELAVLEELGKFDLVLLVNALHEVFSAGYSPETGEIDVPLAKQRVEQALLGIKTCVSPGGYLVVFDGLEPSGDPSQKVQIQFLSDQAREEFELFVRQYHPFRIRYREVDTAWTVEMSRRDFTRYITKSIFVRKVLWEKERFESYQYYSEAEFREVLGRLGFEISEAATFTVNGEKWRDRIKIQPSEDEFPIEHILILAYRPLNESS